MIENLMSVALGQGLIDTACDEDQRDAILLRVVVQPLIVWLWIGGGIMALGTVLAAWPGRRRRPTDPVSAPIDVEKKHPREPVAVG